MSYKTVVITGTSSGIGLVTAVTLAKDGAKRYKVYATVRDMTRKGPLEEAAGSCLDDTLLIREMDVTKDESVKSFFTALFNDESKLDILVNNAGIGLSGIFEALPIEMIRMVMETNYFGPVRTIQSVIPRMKRQLHGRIINISTGLGVAGVPFTEAYVSSKFALEGLTETLAPTLRKFNVFISTVQFGPVDDTAFFPKVSEALNQTDTSGVDKSTHNLFRMRNRNFQNRIARERQTSEEAARFVITVIEDDQPKLMHQSSESVVKHVSGKVKDSTGETIVQSQTVNFLTE
ncbi:retinol dehydrogenase 8-like [Glandiceps talaboti]